MSLTARLCRHFSADAGRDILDAAERLPERGAPATGSAVAPEAGLSRVTVYAHFPTREDVHGMLAAGLEVELLRGSDPGGGLEDTPAYFVLARRAPSAADVRISAGRRASNGQNDGTGPSPIPRRTP